MQYVPSKCTVESGESSFFLNPPFFLYPSLNKIPAERMISSLLECELAFINTSHPSFIGGLRAVSQVKIFQLLERALIFVASRFGGQALRSFIFQRLKSTSFHALKIY